MRDDERMERVFPSRYLIWGGVGLGVLILVAAVLSARDPASFDSNSPEAVVQEYVNAVFDHDATRAHALLSDDIAAHCPERDLRAAWIPEEARVVLVDTTTTDDMARIQVQISESDNGLGLPVAEYTHDVTVVLTQFEEGWRISEPPWPIEYCDGGLTP